MKIYTEKTTQKVIQPNRAWRDSNGYLHPANWASVWSNETLAQFGVEVTNGTEIDKRFYDGSGKAKNLADLKSVAIDRTKQLTGNMLEGTDWYVIRKVERDVAIPSNIATWRAAIIEAASVIEGKITGAKSLDDFKALYDGSPAPIYDFPNLEE